MELTILKAARKGKLWEPKTFLKNKLKRTFPLEVHFTTSKIHHTQIFNPLENYNVVIKNYNGITLLYH